MTETDLIIVGGGAAGMMGGCIAGDLGIRTVILERKHKPGRKLLMCGNSRCNLTLNVAPERMLAMYGEPVGPFLRQAITAFPSSALQRWFAANGLKTVVRIGNKVYPHTDRASDVLHFFTDYLRDRNVSMAVSSAVTSLQKIPNGFRVITDNFAVEGGHVLLATGGLSYPKTGSVGDGQLFAKKLGHAIEPYRPGLVGFEVDRKIVANHVGESTDNVRVKIVSASKIIGETRGCYEIEKWGIGGSAVTDASRIIARLGLTDYLLRIEFPGGQTQEIKPLNTRSIKEAMVTVGGVSLKAVNSHTMESLKCPDLYFAGEVMDVDGPTGGYNLQAAFSSARLAVTSIGSKLGLAKLVEPAHSAKHRHQRANRPGSPWGGTGRCSAQEEKVIESTETLCQHQADEQAGRLLGEEKSLNPRRTTMAYVSIDGEQYEKELLDLAKQHTTGVGEGKLSKDEVAALFKSAQDGQGVTDTEKRTLAYIRKQFEFTDAAAADFDNLFAAL